jgi:hypothetical protein
MKRIVLVIPAAVLSVLLSCDNDQGGPGTNSGSTASVPSSVQPTQSAYTLSVFAQAPGALLPDDMVQVGKSVFVVYQDNNDNPDGTIADGVASAQSEVIEYDLTGKVLQTFDVPGHPDGLVAYDADTVWVSSNEDANPLITVINVSTNALKTWTSDTPTLPHGGGLDDMKVIGGVVYASGSNPTVTTTPVPNLAPYSTDSSGATGAYGVNTGPVVYAISLNSDGATFHSTPVAMSSTPATLLPGTAVATLNMTDADSSAIDPGGDLVTISQQDSEAVFIKNINTESQSISVLPLTLYGNPWPIDDIRWSPPTTGNAFMLLSDNTGQLIYRLDVANGGFAPNTAYAAGQGTLLLVNTTSGVMTPLYVGMKTPHGLMFVTE